MDSKSSVTTISSESCHYRHNREAAQRLLCKYEEREMSSVSSSADNYMCQLFACLLGQNYYAFNHCYGRIKMRQSLKPAMKTFELIMQIGAANYQNNMSHVVQSIALFSNLKDLSQEVRDMLSMYRNYLTTKIFILYVVGFDRFKEKELLGLLTSLGVKEIEDVGKCLEGYESGILSYEGKKDDRWVEVKRDLADAFLERYDPTIVKADLEDIKSLVEVMKLVENKNDWRVDLANQSVSEFRMAHHEESEHDHMGHFMSGGMMGMMGGMFGGMMGPAKFKQFR